MADTAARLEPLCAELAPQAAQIRREQRHLDRQRRANNLDNYLPNGTVKRGRKSLHGRLAHQIVRQGSTFLLEKVSYRAWQRRFGRSVQRRAPGMFVQILTRLAASAGGKVITVPTRSTKLSQTCQCGKEKKKPLSVRVHTCEHCGVQMQRGLYSAYLIRFVDPKTFLLHADQARAAAEGRHASESVVRSRFASQLQESGCCNGTSARAGLRRR